MDHIHTFLTTQGHGGPPRMSDQPNAGATSETVQTGKTIHTKHTLSHPNKANMEWWLRQPNDIRGPCGPKVSWRLSYRWGKTPKKTSPRRPVPTGDRTRARCVTSAYATTCSTAEFLFSCFSFVWYVPSLNIGLTPPGTYNSNIRGSMPVGEP